MNGNTDEVLEAVKERYGAIARSAGALSCGTGGCCTGADDPISSKLYSTAETGGLPAEAVAASLGCGNPTALIDLKPGETVLDLGSGGGIDVLLSARRVGPAGKVYGVDATDDMLALARENQRKAGAVNVEFLKGTIEAIPLPDASVDVIISNCVINLSADKDAVLREAFRVLKPGGRFLCLEFSDVEMPILDKVYEAWSFNAIPQIGKMVAGDGEPYRYLVESIRKFPNQSNFAGMIRAAGFERETWRNYSGGIAALHSAWKL